MPAQHSRRNCSAGGLRFLLASLAGRPPLSPLFLPCKFGVPADYAGLAEQLRAAGHPFVAVAPLTRPAWLRIVPAALTKDYWQCKLKVVA